jgi:hypothetical protein
MAKRSQDLAAAKAKKQKIILIVGGVLLLAVGAFQGPKLLKHGGSPAPEASASSDGTGVASTPAAATAPKGSAMVAGVVLPKATVVKVAPSQLASFTLFEVKDPFVQGVDDEATVDQSTSSSADASGSQSTSGSTSSSSADAGSAGGAVTPAAPAPPPIVYATINVDGKAQQVQSKDKFPAGSPLFVVRSVKKKQVKIGVAGGSFDDSQTVTLKQGKKVTLVNTATGVRYELKLVYTGAQPEVIQSFTTTSGSTAGSGAGSTTPTTTTTGQ